MHEVYCKFIIETNNELGDCIILAKCIFHKELATDLTKVKGGGMWKFDRETNTMILYGESHDFGKASLENIKDCISSKNIYSNKSLYRCISDRYKFAYDTGGYDLINL